LIALAFFPGETAQGGRRIVLAFLGIIALVTQAQEDVPMSLFPLWDHSLNVRTGFGWRDNVLLSHRHQRSSAFLSAGLEGTAFRLAEDGTQLSFLLTADDNRYLSVPQVDDELLVLSQALLRKPFASEWQATASMEYFYQDQVLDVSATEVNLRTIDVKGHNVQFTPALRRNMAGAGWLEISTPVARRIFREPLDSYWEGGPKMTFGHPYGRKSEWTIGYSFVERPYDTRPETTATGRPVPSTSLDFRQHKLEAASWHFWDEARHWRTVTKLSYRLNEDNGSGYFDYGRAQLSEQLRFRTKAWELLAEARFAHYLFDQQIVSATDRSKRQLAEFIWHLRAERQFTKWLRGYLDFEQERSLSNQPVERYTVNTISGGVVWQF
jgi:hypothetical protein